MCFLPIIIVFLLEACSVWALQERLCEIAEGECLYFVFLPVFFILVALETAFARKMTKMAWGELLLPVCITHLPWLLFWTWPWFCGLAFPDPHNFILRKTEVLLGLMWTLHLFLFTMWLVWRADSKSGIPKIAGRVAVFFFAGTALWTVSACDLSGDEPHYLVMAQSLLQDGDLDLSNNYRDRTYDVYYHRGELQPQALEHVRDGRRYSHHPVGTVLLLLPGFFLAGRLGAALTMALLAALAFYLSMRVLEETGARGWPLKATAGIGLFSSPLLLFSGLIFPEIPTACLVAGSLLLFVKKRWAWLGFCLGAMLWVHNRNVLLVIPFLLFAAHEIFRQRKDLAAQAGKFMVAFIMPVAVLVIYFHQVYGMMTPLGAHNEAFASLFPIHRFFIGFFGLVLDQECGLWFHFPVFALMLAGGALLFQSRHSLKLLAASTFCFFYLFMSFYQNIGLAPAGRYMVGVTPLLLVALYAAFEKMKRGGTWARLAVFLFAVGVFVNWTLAAVPWMRYNKLQGENWILKIAGGFLGLPLTRWDAAFQAPAIEPKSYLLSLFWLGVVVVLTALFLRKFRNGKRER